MSQSNPISAEGEDVHLPFRVIVTPHRSLSPRGFGFMMLAIGLASFTTGMVFVLRGAWPVMGFFGLDVFLVWLAFRLNYRAGRARETIEIGAGSMQVRQCDAKGREAVTAFNPYWARLERAGDSELGTVTLHLAERGHRLEIGAVLSPEEKHGLASAIDRALALARAA
ncbi:MAG: DUF2244 domain-containing protein [Rhodobiaceae bacterium]|nr:DUF2244 domain-containing protein [Rhodobiaceae bacterium]MCC0055417.1 DUF2244 domain-containing protein [Rhodobiaceae bacterium]